ncbi:MAG: hypothetical protein Kow0031_24120 [Anaerolineae bacterium]
MDISLNPTRQTAIRQIAPAIPYAAVIVGLYMLHSAWASILLYHAGMVAVLAATRSWQVGQPITGWQSRLAMAVVAAVSASAGIAIFVLWPIMKLPQLALAVELTRLGLQDFNWSLFIFYYFTVNPVLEELFWRGCLGSNSRLPTWNDAWFAGYHLLVIFLFVDWPWLAASFALLVAVAWFWRQLAGHYHSLWPPIISHAAADFGIIGAVFLLVS